MICILKIQAGLLLYLSLTYASLMTGLKNVTEKPDWGCGGMLLFACVYTVREPEYEISILSLYSCGDKHQVSLSPHSSQTAKKAHLHLMS